MIHNNEMEKDFIDGHCLETRVKFLVYPGNMSPEEVTALLHLKPTKELIRGQSITNRIGRTHIQPINFWMISSEEQINSLNLSEHLDWMLNSIISSKDQILLLQKK
jgi:hypothetical protein